MLESPKLFVNMKQFDLQRKEGLILIVISLRENFTQSKNVFSLLSDLVVAGLSLNRPLSKALGLDATSLLALH